MSVVRIRPEAEIRAQARRAFEAHRTTVLAALPDAEVEHVGAAAVPGALTKGDVDVLVRVSLERFAYAVDGLKRLYSVHQPDNWTATVASFADREVEDIPVGVQLVVAGSDDDVMFGAFRDALLSDAELLAEYNELKRRHDGCRRHTEATRHVGANSRGFWCLPLPRELIATRLRARPGLTPGTSTRASSSRAVAADGNFRVYPSRNEADTGMRFGDWSLVVCSVTDADARSGQILGWCNATHLADRLPSDAIGGRWESTSVVIAVAELAPGLPP